MSWCLTEGSLPHTGATADANPDDGIAIPRWLRGVRAGMNDDEGGSMHSEFPSAPFTPWEFRPDAGWAAEFDLIGYHVEAADGSIGKVHEATHGMGVSHLV